MADNCSDIFSDSESDGEDFVIRRRPNKTVHQLLDLVKMIVLKMMWVKIDKSPTLGPFTGNPGAKQIPSDWQTF